MAQKTDAVKDEPKRESAADIRTAEEKAPRLASITGAGYLVLLNQPDCTGYIVTDATVAERYVRMTMHPVRQ